MSSLRKIGSEVNYRHWHMSAMGRGELLLEYNFCVFQYLHLNISELTVTSLEYIAQKVFRFACIFVRKRGFKIFALLVVHIDSVS